MADKLDGVQGQLRSAESEVATFRGRVNKLERRLSKDQRLLSAESQYRDQLTERNTLLLTIYQYMDKILGVDKTPVRSFSLLFLVGTCPLMIIHGARRKEVKQRRNHSPTSVSSTIT